MQNPKMRREPACLSARRRDGPNVTDVPSSRRCLTYIQPTFSRKGAKNENRSRDVRRSHRRGRILLGPRKACCRVLPTNWERPTYQLKGEGGRTYIPKRQQNDVNRAQTVGPKRNSTVGTPADLGERVKRGQNEIRTQTKR